MTPEQLATRLSAAIPTQLKCVALYGSAAAGDFVPGASNYNVLVLLEPITVAELDAIAPAVVEWHRAGYAPPLLFTPTGLLESTDAFPIELLDIHQSRRILWGPDLLAGMRVEPEHLRLQVERELTGKLSSLRRNYLLTEGKVGDATELMARALSSILVLFRAALRLYQEDVPTKKLDALVALRKHIDFDTAPFQCLFEMKQKPDGRGAAVVTFDSFVKAIDAVANAVNSQSEQRRSNP